MVPIKAQAPSSMTMPVLKMNPSPKYWERSRMFQGIPTIERTANGRLWAAWYAGPIQEANEGTYIVLVTSGDDGKTWSKPVAVCDSSTYFDGKSWDPRLWRGPDGSLWFTVARTLTASSDGHPLTSWSFRAKDPENPYTEWEDPIFAGFGVSLNKPTVLSDGTILAPVDDGGGKDNLQWWASQDQGHSFRPFTTIPNAPDGRKRRHCEHMLVERKDGSLWMLVRAEYGIAQAESYDRGRTWQNYRPFTDKMAIYTRFYLSKLRSGNLLLVLNDDPKARNTMVAMLSEDEGKTWPHKLVLDERTAVTYPDATETDTGLLYIVYDWGRYLLNRQEILFAKITEEDIKAGKLVDQRSSLKNTINKLSPYGGGVTKDWEPLAYEKQHGELKQRIEAEKLARGAATPSTNP
jgi:predicted neuraminidase